MVRDDSVHRVQETQAALGYALWHRVQERMGAGVVAAARYRVADGTPAATADAREAAVLDRITEFRRRRPRLRDEVITLAHGAGGKASAALVDAVFLEAFTDGEPEPLPDAATLTLAHGRAARVQHRLLRREAAALPGRIDRPSRGARHGERPRGAGRAARGGCPSPFVIEEGFPVAELREIVADMADAARRGGRGRSSPATRRSSAGGPPTVCSSPPRASA